MVCALIVVRVFVISLSLLLSLFHLHMERMHHNEHYNNTRQARAYVNIRGIYRGGRGGGGKRHPTHILRKTHACRQFSYSSTWIYMYVCSRVCTVIESMWFSRIFHTQWFFISRFSSHRKKTTTKVPSPPPQNRSGVARTLRTKSLFQFCFLARSIKVWP